MRYCPASCLDCGRAALVAEPVESRAVVCPRCGGEGQLLPGAYYGAADRERFDRVESTVHEAKLALREASEVALGLEQAARLGGEAPAEARRALARFARLAALQAIVPEGRGELHAFIGLTLTLLSFETGVRTRRFSSGERPLVTEASEQLARTRRG